MFLMHPAFLACSAALSLACRRTIRRGGGFAGRMLAVFVLLSLVNPLFNAYGDTVLFFWPWGRGYTLEALAYGMAAAAMVVSVLAWFSSFNEVMTSDKLLYLFGRAVPSVTLVLTMVFRLIPSYKRKIVQMNGARRCIGMALESGPKKERARHGLVLLSALTSWALEGGIVTADSMRSRGFGCGKRTSFSLCRFEKRDKCLLALMLALGLVVVVCAAKGGAAASYTPRVEAAGPGNPYFAAGILAYAAFLSIPTAVNLLEELQWRSLRSKI